MKRLWISIFSIFLTVMLLAGCGNQGEVTPSPTPAITPPTASATPPSEPAAAPVYTPMPVPTPVTFPTDGFINGEGVNIRQEPDTKSDIVDILGQNTVVNALSLEDGWYMISLNGEHAYVKEDLLTLGDPPRPDNTRYAEVAVASAKLYTAPDGKTEDPTTLKQGNKLKVLRALGDYLHVVYNQSLQRYILTSDVTYISVEAFSGIAAVSPSPGTTSPTPIPGGAADADETE